MLKPMPSPNGTNRAKLYIAARRNPVAAYDSAAGMTKEPSDGSPDFNELVQSGDAETLAQALAKSFSGDLMGLMNALSECIDAGGQPKANDDDDEPEMAFDQDQSARVAKIIADAKAYAKKKLAQDAASPAAEARFNRRWSKTAGRIGIDTMGIK